jgi:hypothetical protein
VSTLQNGIARSVPFLRKASYSVVTPTIEQPEKNQWLCTAQGHFAFMLLRI